MKKSFHNPCTYGNDECPKCTTPMPNTYNKEEVMKAVSDLKCVNGAMYFGSVKEPCEGRKTGECCHNEQSFEEAEQELKSFLSTALDSAYKAGREEMYLAGGKACKKAFQNHKEDHLCRFNDGEQNCNCYLSGINEVIVTLEALI